MIKLSGYRTLMVLFALVAFGALMVFLYVKYQSLEKTDSLANKSLSANGETSFIDLSGSIMDLSQFNNQIRVVNSWATWSPLSQKDLTLLNDLAASYKDRQVAFLAINRKENKDYAKGYLDKIDSLESLTVVFDPADNFFTTVKGYAMPETIVFDKTGNIQAHFRGNINEAELRQVLDELLADNP